jgi:hypothetical protein
MSLLLDEDYKILAETDLQCAEDEDRRFLIFTNFPLPHGVYVNDGKGVDQVEVLVVIPSNYNSTGTDMLWTYPRIRRADNGPMPNVCDYGGSDNRTYAGKEYCRWSRHYDGNSWKAKIDNVQKILGRIEWALKNPAT